ncbi:MAG TPA: PDZ domain-containing protein [Phycisphaerales bacterium]|nr:PDZ domain-containing protein [Phycisphaerales bacterium]
MRFCLSILLIALAMVASTAWAQPASDELPRRVWLGTVFSPRDAEASRDPREALRVTKVIKDATADRAGVREGDILLAVNDTPVKDWTQVAALTRGPRAGETGFVTVERDGKTLRLETKWVAMPMEAVPGVTTRYSSVRTPAGYQLRTIIASPNRPAGDTRKLPAFLYLQGLACVSIDRATMTGFPDTDIARELASRGFVTMRVDKPGVGDSQGPACGDIGFGEELEAYRAAFDSLTNLPEVDTDRIYIFGYSFGGIFAPFVAEDRRVAGIAVYGTTARTWLEYELENTRRQMTVLQESPADVSERLQHVSEFQSMLLLQKMTPGEIFAAKPALRFEAPMMDDTHQYGRHAKFFHELQDRNIAAAWQRVQNLNVLAMHGEYDWVSSADDGDLIVRIASSSENGRGEMQIMDGLDHGMTSHSSLADSVTKFAQGQWTGGVTAAVADWVQRTTKQPARKPLPPDSK